MPATEHGSVNGRGIEDEEDTEHLLKPPDPELVDAVHTLKLQDPDPEGTTTASPLVSTQDQASDIVVPPPASKAKNGIAGATASKPKNGAAGATASKPKNGAAGAPASKPKNSGAPASKPKNTTTKEKRTGAEGATTAVEKTKKKDGLPPLSPASTRGGAAAAAPSSCRPATASGGAVTRARPPGPGRKLVQPLISKKMSTSSASANQTPCSEGECSAPSDQISEPIEIEDDEEPVEEEEEDGPATGAKRKAHFSGLE